MTGTGDHYRASFLENDLQVFDRGIYRAILSACHGYDIEGVGLPQLTTRDDQR